MPVPILNIAQMREWERATWATGQTEAEVIIQNHDDITSSNLITFLWKFILFSQTDPRQHS